MFLFYDWSNDQVHLIQAKFYHDLISFNEMERELWTIRKKLIQKLFKAVSGDWRLFMFYDWSLDTFAHIYLPKHLDKLRRVYIKTDLLISRLKKVLPKDILFLIVSDHGIDKETGLHSNHAFYSVNVKINWRPVKITDFYSKIQEWCPLSRSRQLPKIQKE